MHSNQALRLNVCESVKRSSWPVANCRIFGFGREKTEGLGETRNDIL